MWGALWVTARAAAVPCPQSRAAGAKPIGGYCGPMSPGAIVTLILVLGVAMVIAATIADRRNAPGLSARRSQSDSLPGRLDTPAVTEPPAYITSSQLLDQAPPAARFTPDEERELAAQLAQPATTKIVCWLAAPTLATHTGTRAILDQPAVLVCPDSIGQFRELAALLASASADRVPLLIAAPAVEADTLQTVIANKLGGTVAVAVVLGDEDALTTLAAAAETPLSPRADRQSGAAGLRSLGRASRIVADLQATWVIV